MKLKGKKIAILVEDGYDELEFWYPKIRMLEEGAKVVVIGSPAKDIFASKHGITVKADKNAAEVKADEFDGIIIPGGYAPDRLRRYKEILDFVRESYEKGKTIAAICHACHVLISAGILKGKKVTAFFSIRDDIVNAGAEYLDEPVVVDGNIVTSRNPNDLPYFCKAIIENLEK